MPSSNKFILALLAAALASPAAAKVLDDTVAVVNGQPILLSEYKKNLDSVVEQYKKNLPDIVEDTTAVKQLRQKVLDQMIDDELMAQKASDVKVTEREIDNGVVEIKDRFKRDEAGKAVPDEKAEAAFTEELQQEGLSLTAFRERLKKQIRVRKWIDDQIRPSVKPPTDGETKTYFEKMIKLVDGDTSTLAGLSPMETQQMTVLTQRLKEASAERVRARHILIKVSPNATMVEKSQALKRIKEIHDQLKKGADFAALARDKSEDPATAKHGGDLGFFLKGWMVPEFEKAAFSLGVGELSDIVETQFGYHVIRVEEKRAAQKPSFEEVKEQLQQALFAMNVQKALEKKVGELRAKATIKIETPLDKVTTTK
jgi:parvulin-like peptidyl-prolyl isomerase